MILSLFLGGLGSEQKKEKRNLQLNIYEWENESLLLIKVQSF
jgi:hypothetical protein